MASWIVGFTSKAEKQYRKLPNSIKEKLVVLLKEIEELGPVRGSWMNYSKLSSGDHHCHLKKGRPTYVVCWRVKDKRIQVVEVYYVGTHEKAPY